MHRGFRASLTLSLSRVSTRARSFRQQSCRFWTPILLHSSPPARVLASPGKFLFYFSSFAVISSLFHGSWYCLMRPACSAGKFSWLLQRTVFFPAPWLLILLFIFLKDNGNALIVVPCCVYGKFNCLDFMHVLCFAAGRCLRAARSCSPVMSRSTGY